MRAKRSLGQNFLRDTAVISKIVDALGPIANEKVVEIGPGRGALTEKLLETAREVFAIEFDRDMVAILEERFAGHKNFHLINADALHFDYSQAVCLDNPAKLVANLPYNISTPILQGLADQRELFSTMVLMFQREVVERITAPAGGKERGFLSVIVEDAFKTECLFDVSPESFRPVPKVWSSVVRLTPKPLSGLHTALFRKVVSASFAQRRKTLLNNLKAVLDDPVAILTKSGIDPQRRAETLTLEEFRQLAEHLEKIGKEAATKKSYLNR